MKRIIASDIHFSHKNILKYCGNPRLDASFTKTIVDEEGEFAISGDEVDTLISVMNERIISNWNEVVEPDDEVYILGDVAMGQIKFAPDLIRRLNGRKHLVAGNHDKTLIKLIGNDSTLSDLFVWIKDYHEMSHALPGGKKNLMCMSHFPFRCWNGMNQGSLFIHGHLHGSPCDVPGRIMDVGIDTNNLRPYLMDDVVTRLLQITEIGSHH